MMRRTLRAIFAACAIVACLVASTMSASAKTYSHGRTVWFGHATVGGDDVVNGDLSVVFGDVVCEPGAVITGDVRTYSGSFTQLDTCQVGGTIENAFNSESLVALAPWLSDDAESMHLYRHFGFDIVVLLMFLIFPLRVRVALDRVEKHPGLSAAVGTLTIVSIVPLSVLLVLSVLGIPLIVLEAAALFGGLWIGQAAVALLVGRRLWEAARPHATPSPLGALVLGLLLISAAELIPVLGWAVTALVWLVGLGAAVLAFVQEATAQSFAPGRPITGPPVKTV